MTGAITVGTSALGAGTAPGTSADAEAVSLATAMLLGPFPAVDTSNAYGAGRSEMVLGRALATLDRPASARVITKVDRDPHSGAFDRDRVLRSYEESLARLGMDRVEVLHLHDPYTVHPQEALGPGGAVAGLLELRDTGACDAIGIAAGPIPLLTAYVATGLFDAVLSHNRFTLVDRTAEPLFAAAHERKMTVFNAAPFGGSILSRGAVHGASYGYAPASVELRGWVRRAEAVCADHGVTLAAAALHFSTRSPWVDSTVVGVSSVSRLEELAALAAVAVPEDLWGALDDLGPAPSPIRDGEDAA